MALSADQMREMLDSLPDGDLENGEVLSDALAEAGYIGAARALNKFLAEAWPIEREIRRKKIPAGPQTQRLYATFPKRVWFAAKRLVRMAISMQGVAEHQAPLVWYNVEAGGFEPTLRRRVKRNMSYPVLFRGKTLSGISKVHGQMIGVVPIEHGILPMNLLAGPRSAVQASALSPVPRYALAPNASIYRDVMR